MAKLRGGTPSDLLRNGPDWVQASTGSCTEGQLAKVSAAFCPRGSQRVWTKLSSWSRFATTTSRLPREVLLGSNSRGSCWTEKSERVFRNAEGLKHFSGGRDKALEGEKKVGARFRGGSMGITV